MSSLPAEVDPLARFHPPSLPGCPLGSLSAGRLLMDLEFDHTPVMAEEITALFGVVPAGAILDGTLGGAGHANRLLQSRDDITLIGLDRDPVALAAARQRLGRFGDRVVLEQANFGDMASVVNARGVEMLSGILLDLGVSSPQFDDAARGFSYRNDAPLDMRMDQSSGISAAQIVNETSLAELLAVLRRGGEDRFTPRIAAAIVAARPILGTARLAEVVSGAIPAYARRKGGHPAKRTFQALRIAVNGELDALESALTSAAELLVPGGRLVVLSYHSGEDSMVKAAMRAEETGGCTCPRHLPCGCGAVQRFVLLARGAQRPTKEEIARNPRAGSARLRAAQRLDDRKVSGVGDGVQDGASERKGSR